MVAQALRDRKTREHERAMEASATRKEAYLELLAVAEHWASYRFALVQGIHPWLGVPEPSGVPEMLAKVGAFGSPEVNEAFAAFMKAEQACIGVAADRKDAAIDELGAKLRALRSAVRLDLTGQQSR